MSGRIHDASDRVRPGRFGYQPVLGVVEAAAEARYEPLLGLPMSMQYLYGSLYGPGGEYFWPIRGFYRERARYLHIAHGTVETDLGYAPEGSAAYQGPVAHVPEGRGYVTRTSDGVPLLWADGDQFRWSETGAVEVEAERVSPTMQFHVPDVEVPLVYTSAAFRAVGTVLGVPVEGWLFHDSIHMPQGMDIVRSPYIEALEGAWVAFVTEFEDGEVHCGHLIWGTDRFQGIVLTRTDGPTLIARDVGVEYAVDGHGYPERVTYRSLTAGRWTWTARPGGRMPIRGDVPEGHRWRQGVVRQEGEARAVARSEALMEVYLDRLPRLQS